MKTYDYRYRLAVPGGHATCRIRIYRAAGGTICLATERHDKFGGHLLAEHTAELAAQIGQWHRTDAADMTWVEQDDYPNGDGPTGQLETFAVVALGPGGGQSQGVPRRQPADRAAIEALIGQAIDN